MLDKTIVVTGASSGIGAHITRRLVGDGARVVAAARRIDRLTSLAESLKDGPGKIAVVQADVTVPGDAALIANTAADRFGGLDGLVNNAGVSVEAGISALAAADIEHMMRTNVIGAFLCMQAALPLLEAGRGSVVNIGSALVVRFRPGRFGYAASKAALETMSRALAAELGPRGIRVNVIRPGLIPSELRGKTEEEEAAAIAARAPGIQALPGAGTGADVAGTVAYLLSDDAAWVTGAVIDVDGGLSLGRS